MTALFAMIPRWVYAALIAMLAATSCKFKWDKDGLALEVEKHKVAAAQLEAQGIGADVVSMVCTELFDEQDAAYRAEILPADALIVSVEAASTFGWQRYTGTTGLNIGIDSFGASAPAGDLFAHFGFTADKIVPQILNKLNG